MRRNSDNGAGPGANYLGTVIVIQKMLFAQ